MRDMGEVLSLYHGRATLVNIVQQSRTPLEGEYFLFMPLGAGIAAG